MPSQALPGFRDFFPDDLALRAHIFRTWREVARRYGFTEYDGPPLEPLDLYTSKSGAEIVGQLYNFTDKGGREVALRPEMTPTFARMVGARANGLRKPIRWFSIPQLFRYERQQRGRLREHFQLNCDLVGEPGPLADAELIALAIDIMRAFGFTSGDVKVRLSDRRVLSALLGSIPVNEDAMPAVFGVLDKLERIGADAARQQLVALGLTEAQAGSALDIVSLNRLDAIEARLAGTALAAAVEPLRATCDALADMGLGEWVELDLRIVRGLAYYTGTVFELFDAGKSLRAICGGGRYDGLLQSLGGVDLPALGFGMGDVVLAELLRDHGRATVAAAGADVFVATTGANDAPFARALVHELRDAGLSTEFALGDGPLGKQLKLADARAARFAVVIGPDDRASGAVTLRDLRAKHQHAVARDAVAGEIAARLLTSSSGTPSHG